MSKTGDNETDLSLDTVVAEAQPAVQQLVSYLHFLPVSTLTPPYFMIIRNDTSWFMYKTSQLSSNIGGAYGTGNLGKLGDYLQSYLYLQQGTYFATIEVGINTDHCQIQILVDDVNVTNTLSAYGTSLIDLYGVAQKKVCVPVNEKINISESKIHDIKVKIVGKNAANTAGYYAAPFRVLSFVRSS